VVKVEFYADFLRLGSISNAPYSLTWTNVRAGIYSLTARATDDDGGFSTSSAVVIVVNTNQPPSVQLVSPTEAAAYFLPLDLTIQAETFDIDGVVTNVDFYSGTSLLGSVTTAPFSFSWSDVPVGTHDLSVRATDDRGATATSQPVTITVTMPAPLALGAMTMLPEGAFEFQVSGQAGGRFLIEASTNLTDWTSLGAYPAPTGVLDFKDVQSTNLNYRFYRVLYGPW
jgi:hypothetical protein